MHTDLTTMTLDDLAGMARDAATQQSVGKQIAAQVQAELSRRYKDTVNTMLAKKEDPFGSTHLIDGEYTISADLSKKVSWDEKLMREMAKELGPQAEEYLDIEYSMKESKFKALPQTQRDWFARARTVTPGSLKITLEKKSEEEKSRY